MTSAFNDCAGRAVIEAEGDFMRLKPFAFLTCVVGLVAFILLSGVGSPALVRAGSYAPEFTVKNLDGEEVSLGELKGRVVFLNFWRTDCPPCAAEMPDLELVAKRFHGRKFQMMPVSLDFDADEVSRFYRARNLTMPAFFDPHQRVSGKFHVTRTPETFVIDSEGNVAKYYIGQQRWTSPKMLAMPDEMIPD
jgi:peroxiredoxin